MDDQKNVWLKDEDPLCVDPVRRLVLPDQSETKYTADKRRWYLLFLLILAGIMSNLMWNFWPPIQETCQLVFNWTDENILLIGVISSFTGVVVIIPSSWVLNRKGLRFTVLFSVAFHAIASIILIFPISNHYQALVVYISTFIVGSACPICQTLAFVVFVASWFPPSERTLAMVLTFLLSDLGIALSYICGPYLVPDVGKYHTGHKIDIDVLRRNTSAERMNFLRDRIRDYIYLESAVMSAILVCIFIYFPDKPKEPPCASSVYQRLDFLRGIKRLLRNRDFFVLLVVYSLCNGVQWGWLIVMDVVLSKVGINQKVVGWIGFGMRWFVFPAILASSFSNLFRDYIKPSLSFLFFGAACFQTAYSLACNKILPLSQAVLFATAFLHNMFFCANEPLLLDLGAEAAFPVAEAITTGVMFTAANMVELAFFVTFTFILDKDNNPLWMNWVLASVEVFCIPVIFIYSGKRKRLEVDLVNKRDEI